MLWDPELTLRLIRLENTERVRSAEQRRLLRTVVRTPQRRQEKPR